MASTSVTVRIDENLKKRVEVVFDSMGLNMTTAFNIFVKAVVRQNKLPFEIVADPFYSEENMARLRKSKEQMETTGGTIRDISQYEELVESD